VIYTLGGNPSAQKKERKKEGKKEGRKERKRVKEKEERGRFISRNASLFSRIYVML